MYAKHGGKCVSNCCTRIFPYVAWARFLPYCVPWIAITVFAILSKALKYLALYPLATGHYSKPTYVIFLIDALALRGSNSQLRPTTRPSRGVYYAALDFRWSYVMHAPTSHTSTVVVPW